MNNRLHVLVTKIKTFRSEAIVLIWQIFQLTEFNPALKTKPPPQAKRRLMHSRVFHLLLHVEIFSWVNGHFVEADSPLRK